MASCKRGSSGFSYPPYKSASPHGLGKSAISLQAGWTVFIICAIINNKQVNDLRECTGSGVAREQNEFGAQPARTLIAVSPTYVVRAALK
jgi:hypothetical protein